MDDIKCGQVWELKDEEKNYNVGGKGDLFIILSRDNDLWTIACFWFSGSGEPGGARQKHLEAYEIKEIGRYVGEIKSVLKAEGIHTITTSTYKQNQPNN